jgi:hypothetical protein
VEAFMHSRIGQLALARGNKASDFSDKSSEISDAMRLVRLAAEPQQIGDSKKAQIGRAARTLGWSYTRARDIWYGCARRIEVNEMDALRELEQRSNAAELDGERWKNLEQIAMLKARLEMRDRDFHAHDIAALQWMLDQLGG